MQPIKHFAGLKSKIQVSKKHLEHQLEDDNFLGFLIIIVIFIIITGNALAGAVIGRITGVAGGMFTKVVSRATAAADKVEEKAFKKAAELVAGKAVKHADSLGKMVEKTGEKAMIYGLNVLEEKNSNTTSKGSHNN